MNLKEKLLNLRASLTSKTTSYRLDKRVDAFIDWYKDNMTDGYTDIGKFNQPLEVRNFIEKMAVWYELRYPSYEVNRLMPGSGQEINDVNNIIKKNTSISNIEEMSSDDEKTYLRDVIDMVKWEDLYSTRAFISSLPFEEKWYLDRPKYPNLLYLDKDHKIHFHVTAKGRITEAECPERHPYFTIKSLEGEYVTLAKELLEDTEFWTPKNEVEMAIKNYENRCKIKEGILDCVMYRLIDRDPSRIGPRRAFMFAKEFKRDIDIPMMYGIDYSDPGLRDFISDYIKAGGHADLNCIVGYGSRQSVNQPLECVSLTEVLKLTSCKYRFTDEERTLHQQMVDALANKKYNMEDSQKVLKK